MSASGRGLEMSLVAIAASVHVSAMLVFSYFSLDLSDGIPALFLGLYSIFFFFKQ